MRQEGLPPIEVGVPRADSRHRLVVGRERGTESDLAQDALRLRLGGDTDVRVADRGLRVEAARAAGVREWKLDHERTRRTQLMASPEEPGGRREGEAGVGGPVGLVDLERDATSIDGWQPRRLSPEIERRCDREYRRRRDLQPVPRTSPHDGPLS
jgi:hypothetical protein